MMLSFDESGLLEVSNFLINFRIKKQLGTSINFDNLKLNAEKFSKFILIGSVSLMFLSKKYEL